MQSPANMDVITQPRLWSYLDDLGEPLRMRIMRLLMKEPMNVTDLTERLNDEESVTRSNISNALSVLEKSNLIFYRKSGRFHTYSVNADLMREIARQIIVFAEEAERSAENGPLGTEEG